MEGEKKKKRKLLDVSNDLKRDKLHLAQQFFFQMNNLLTDIWNSMLYIKVDGWENMFPL